ncbi:3-phosphoshikimate 1-carboxyvinyltransferase [bacterium]|nr:3-phosphoshikimate 1-carboxyvinyltransferase [bacterium]
MHASISPANRIAGTVIVPGDKSISHRALILAALAGTQTTITGLSEGEDVRSTRRCLELLGIRFRQDGTLLHVTGSGRRGLNQPENALDAGNSGTTLRLLAGLLAAGPLDAVLTGDGSLKNRPMDRIIVPLTRMGACIESNDGRAPLHIRGRTLQPLSYASPVASAQVKSCLLLAGLQCRGRTCIDEPVISRDHTERMLPCFGVPVIRDGTRVCVDGPALLQGTGISVPGDISAAAFFMAAAAMLPGSELLLPGVGVNPTRTGIIEVLRRMGAEITLSPVRDESGEPRADITVRGSRLRGVTISGPDIPAVIDEIPVLAVAASRARGTTRIRDAAELRVKETDRIEAVAANLQAMGAAVIAERDGLTVTGPSLLRGTILDSYGDHRIAMAFAVAGLAASGKTTINSADSVNISYPGFFQQLERISER